MKKCPKYHLEKDETEFYSNKAKPNGISVWCKNCNKDYKMIYSKQHINQIKKQSAEYRLNNRDKIKSSNEQYKSNNLQKIRQQQKEQYHRNKKQKQQKAKIYRASHKNEIAIYNKRYNASQQAKERKRNRKNYRKQYDPLFKLKLNISKLILQTLKKRSFTKKSKTYQMLKCSYEEFMTHLGPKPEGGVHLDHTCPCDQAQNEEELIKLQHYSNLRWMNATENLAKLAQQTPEGVEICQRLLGRNWIVQLKQEDGDEIRTSENPET